MIRIHALELFDNEPDRQNLTQYQVQPAVQTSH